MGWDGLNPYYDPGVFGLTIVGTIDGSNGSYEFDYLTVWKHEDGRLFYADDSGCSCPSPFENVHSLDDLTEITQDSFNEFAAKARDHYYREYNYEKGDYMVTSTPAENEELIGKVIHLLGR